MSSRFAIAGLAVLAVALWVTAIAITAARTTIPYAFEAEMIIAVSVHQEHQPGRDDTIFIRTDRRELRIDSNAAECLLQGETVSKSAWSATVQRSGGASCILRPPRQLLAVVTVPISIAVLAGGTVLLGRRIGRLRADS